MDRIEDIADGYWSIRGSFRVAGLLDVGTQSSLVRLASGAFVLLDAYTLRGEVRDEVLRRTNDGAGIEAIINLHPFHTVHVGAVAEAFPRATLYGTKRHHARWPQLKWAPEYTESAAFAERFTDDFDFMVPDGVDFIPSNENLHFASVLAFHRASRVLHVDDTLNYFALPWGARLSFHPTLGAVLQQRPGAAAAFRTWADQLIERLQDVDRVCAAHNRISPVGLPVADEVRVALGRVEKTLRKHEARYGA